MLSQKTLDALDLTTACPRCGATMWLKVVEPHPHIDWLERHTFECTACRHVKKRMLGCAG